MNNAGRHNSDLNTIQSDALQPPFEDVSEQFIATIDGPAGRCFIAWVGGMPERDHAFVYKDRSYHFYFYAEKVKDGATYDVKLRDASVVKFTGPSPHVRADDLDLILDNITRFFERRMFRDSSRPRPETEIFRKLKISWRLAK